MIDRVNFFIEPGIWIRPQEDYGLLMKTYDVTPPAPKIYRVEMDGADGAVDFTEWAGRVLYAPRTVKVELRDMYNRHAGLVQKLLGRMAAIYFSYDLDWYYYGRCDSIETKTERRVTDLAMTFVCQPYKLAHRRTTHSATVSGSYTFMLAARNMPVIPKITLSVPATVTFGGVNYSLAAGDNVIGGIKLTETPATLTVAGNTDVTISWQDGEL